MVAALTVVTVTPATASPFPAPQQPSSNPSEALEEYRELASEAEKINEEYLRAKEDLEDREAELEQAKDELKKAEQEQQRAAAAEDEYRIDVDRFAGASFTAGTQLNKLSALLTVDSAQEFLGRSSALDMLATDKHAALGRLQGAVDQARDAEQQAADARKQAQEAKDAAEKLTADIQARKDRLDEQLDDLAAQAGLLGPGDQAAQQDTGIDVGPVKAPGPAAQVAVDAALGRRGSPYVWGATGPNQFDCSGLTQWAYAQAGISIPRSSGTQATFGTPVARSQLQPGDLVFFYSPVSHVGIYIGNGNMVHAPTTGDVVKVSPLQNQYSGARRVT